MSAGKGPSTVRELERELAQSGADVPRTTFLAWAEIDASKHRMAELEDELARARADYLAALELRLRDAVWWAETARARVVELEAEVAQLRAEVTR